MVLAMLKFVPLVLGKLLAGIKPQIGTNSQPKYRTISEVFRTLLGCFPYGPNLIPEPE